MSHETVSPQSAAAAQACLREFFSALLTRLNVMHALEIGQEPEPHRLHVSIHGDHLAPLIGAGGASIDALDALAAAHLSAQGFPEFRVRVDVGGYRQRRAETLRVQAEGIALRVSSSGEAFTLPPMHPADRRTVHLALEQNPHVVTESVGEGSERCVRVLPAPAL